VRQVDTSQLLKGVLDLAVLAVVADEDAYGYDIVRRLRDAGLDDVGDASVYGTLRRLFRSGALSSYVVPSDEGPHRKYYAVTASGQEALRTGTKTWRHFADVLDALLGTHGRAAA
jgi:PadR family transcriptional regulator PadR